MRQALRSIGLGFVLIGASASLALAQKNQPTPVPIPFEAERAQLRGDKRVLRLNDDATAIPGSRVKYLPITEGRMGERAALDHLELYFPFGRIVAATTEFHKHRLFGERLEADPFYKHVASFDRALGPVCARGVGDNGQPVEMRMNDRAMSLVQFMPGPHDDKAGEQTRSYKVTTFVEIRHMGGHAEASRLYASCLNPTRTAKQ
jgi:hypothetical protein